MEAKHPSSHRCFIGAEEDLGNLVETRTSSDTQKRGKKSFKVLSNRRPLIQDDMREKHQEGKITFVDSLTYVTSEFLVYHFEM